MAGPQEASWYVHAMRASRTVLMALVLLLGPVASLGRAQTTELRPFGRVVLTRGWYELEVTGTIDLRRPSSSTEGVWFGSHNPVAATGWTCAGMSLAPWGLSVSCEYGTDGPSFTEMAFCDAATAAWAHEVSLNSPELEAHNDALPDTSRASRYERATLVIGCE